MKTFFLGPRHVSGRSTSANTTDVESRRADPSRHIRSRGPFGCAADGGPSTFQHAIRSAAFGLLLAIAVSLHAAPPNPGVPWPATDALARSLPLSADTSAPRADRFVGMFYFLWHNTTGGKSLHEDGPYDIGRILARDPDALKRPESPFWGPIGMYHYWGEPLYGYYQSTDPWVLRRHAQLLADRKSVV